MSNKEILLIKMPGLHCDEAQAEKIQKLLSDGSNGTPMSINVHTAVSNAETYVYCWFEDAVSEQVAHALHYCLAAQYPASTATVLRGVQDIVGASHGKPSHWHYVVETDVQPVGDAEVNAWYNEEHLPGLAAVPGTVRAQRFVSVAGSPRYHACYDLETLETFECPAWMAVRATDWSSRARPHFCNTKRTMFKGVA